MTEKSAFDKALGELHDLIEWEDAEAAIRHRIHRHPRDPVLHHLQRRPFLAADCVEQVRAVKTGR